jgi:hypothetical protein
MAAFVIAPTTGFFWFKRCKAKAASGPDPLDAQP